MQRKQPIIIMFYHHWDDPLHRANSVAAVRKVTDIYEKYGVKAHYGFVGAVLQQIAEDSPETVEKIRRLKMPIGYHGGAGHALDGPVGHSKDTRRMGWAEAVRAYWEFETHTLDTDTREPLPRRIGGYLAIQVILDIIPLPTDSKGTGAMDTPGEFVLAAMGAGSYAIQAPFEKEAIVLSPLHEPHLFAGYPESGQLSTYYGKKPGEDAPMMAEASSWFQVLAENLPPENTYVVSCMSHSYFDEQKFEQLIAFLTSHPESFRISHPDINSAQWDKSNSAAAFYKRNYQVTSMLDLLEYQQPPTPSPFIFDLAQVARAADDILSQPQLNTHDGDFAEPPDSVDTGTRRISLAASFQAFTKALKHWKAHQSLPREVEITHIKGPVDYPGYAHRVDPLLGDRQLIGYTPVELTAGQVPDAAVINSQGLPPAGDYHLWMPTHTIADGMEIVAAACALDISEQIPGVIHVRLRTESSRAQSPAWIQVPVNPAEFLYALAQTIRLLVNGHQAGPVVLLNIKIVRKTRTQCTLITPGGPQDSFIWRSPVTPEELDVAWTRVPVPENDQVLWMSLPPLGDKLKRKLGREVGEWNQKKP